MKYFLSLLLLLSGAMASAAVDGKDYELVAASASVQIMGPSSLTTKTGQLLEYLIIVPETTGAGTVAIKDGSDTAINVYVTSTLTILTPIIIPIHARSKTGSWQVTTGSNVHVIAVGWFQ